MTGGRVRTRSRRQFLSGARPRPRRVAPSCPGRPMHRFCIHALPAVEGMVPVQGEIKLQMTAADAVTALMPGDLPVLETPRLLARLEAATCAAAHPLEVGQTTIGTRITANLGALARRCGGAHRCPAHGRRWGNADLRRAGDRRRKPRPAGR